MKPLPAEHTKGSRIFLGFANLSQLKKKLAAVSLHLDIGSSSDISLIAVLWLAAADAAWPWFFT